ncbi:aminotransferase class III-fold pyridoxal phosphate-dependent enzyme [Streptosporangium amethystogenes]|uniref:aminotransferase class III-fold pyridoxal phosphate-dependent enzyme n=1 Tax=Streptosporangium amethystogenes TaxID=2002 RepID=UPI001470382C|nr:aminotransferase class III-fold pyridoxal phosphate-dependent enzyme [Streptosporangium amethystogenes]
MSYRVQFTGPAGTTAVEAAVRLARIAAGRERIVHLSGSYHGMTRDSIGVSGLGAPRGVPPATRGVTTVPHELEQPSAGRASEELERAFTAPGSTPPAAFIVETVQGEGGVRPTTTTRLREIERLCRAHGTLLVVDDIQAGCGRTGPFLSFEADGVEPDVVCLSKSLSGVGLPMGLVLIRPSLDVWDPGEYSGTFRGNNLAFVTARLALSEWWSDGALRQSVSQRSEPLVQGLTAIAARHDWLAPPTGRGLMLGLPCADRHVADLVSTLAFTQGLLVETCGRRGEVVKLLPPLTVTKAEVALQILEHVTDQVAGSRPVGSTLPAAT